MVSTKENFRQERNGQESFLSLKVISCALQFTRQWKLSFHEENFPKWKSAFIVLSILMTFHDAAKVYSILKALFHVVNWAITLLLQSQFPPGSSLATILRKFISCFYFFQWNFYLWLLNGVVQRFPFPITFCYDRWVRR